MSEAQQKPRVFLAQPYYPGFCEARSVVRASVQSHASDRFELKYCPQATTFLTAGFNQLWCIALSLAERGKITHFAMLHADIVPEENWLDVLFDECERLNAVLVSAVSPIKDFRGLTSTAIATADDDRWHVRRLTMHEVFQLPETFCVGDTMVAGLNPQRQALLFNTGCWVADLRKPLWFETNDVGEGYFYFDINHRVLRIGQGDWQTEVESEDWNFSRALARRTEDYYVTRKVRLEHIGAHRFTNKLPWGEWQEDLAFKHREELKGQEMPNLLEVAGV